MREVAAARMNKQAEEMRKRARKEAGAEVDVGTIVQVSVDDVDRAKVDPTNATLVVVEKVCAASKSQTHYSYFLTSCCLRVIGARW